jgi:predicted nucleic acid-binding protein
VIFVDSNIPMYLVGADHPNKEVARRLLERAVNDGEMLVTDAEVLQEILHRYVAIDRRDAIEPASAALLGIIDDVYPVERADVEKARRIVLESRLSARDAIHVAIMRRRGVDQILTFDRAFNEVDGISRIGG